MVWHPHVTVAAVIKVENKFLFVQERDAHGDLVLNQPAGHLEPNESLIDAVIRETLEETAWEIEPTHLISVRLFESSSNGVTYLRTNFAGTLVRHHPEQELDSDIVATQWLTEAEMQLQKLRSPLVLDAISSYVSGQCHPLSIVDTFVHRDGRY